jgi:hypothetical protein
MNANDLVCVGAEPLAFVDYIAIDKPDSDLARQNLTKACERFGVDPLRLIFAKRVGAPEAQACYEDRTRPEVYETLKVWQIAKAEAAKGRPTKKDRRAIDQIKAEWEWGI